MRHLTKIILASAVAATAFASTEASAQTWSPVGALNSNVAWDNNPGTRPFWDNSSSDGAKCNVGWVLSQPGANNNCLNQRPANWLPFTGTPVTSYFSNNMNGYAFTFKAGLYDLTQIAAADIARANTEWGYFDANGDVTLPNSPNFTQRVQFTGSWGLWIQLNTPTNVGRVYSNDPNFARHFALFGYAGNTPSVTNNGNVASLGFNGVGQQVYVGLEDNGCQVSRGPGTFCDGKTDYDNNDVIFSVTSVPEPSTYLLMATGLLGLGVAARRRRNNA